MLQHGLLVWIAAGGALGSVLRYLLSNTVQAWAGRHFPVGVLTVNLLGCALMGLMVAWLVERFNVGPHWRAALMVGGLGGFTTFSSFSLDAVHLFEAGRWQAATVYMALSTLGCVLATWLGLYCGRALSFS